MNVTLSHISHNEMQRLTVWTLKCIGYDNDFQLELSKKFPLWVPPPAKQKTQTTAVQQKPTRRTGDTRGEKRKRAETPESEEDDHEVKVLAYNSKGTRSRPICL